VSEDQYPYTDDGEFVPYDGPLRSDGEMKERASSFYELMARRRSIRTFDTAPVPKDLIETAIVTAGTAPSGAHQQPWTFVLIGDPDTKRRIRLAAEEEERTNYLDGRMPEDWQEAIARLGTSWQKPYLEDAPWIVVLFEQRYGVDEGGSRHKHYYVKESVGIAAGMFISALHNMGLATLTHTPSPMAFLTTLLDRPANERPFILFPIGYPAAGSVVPELERKPLGDILVEYPAVGDEHPVGEMSQTFVPAAFEVPSSFEGPGFRLEPLGPEHNGRDHEAWMSSIEHIRSTPGFGPDRNWPKPMSLEANLADLEMHARHFADREGFTYSILDGDDVIGCVYIYPVTEPDHDASVSSWVRESRAEMDRVVYRSLATWVDEGWPFKTPYYAARPDSG
jgi:nitroreductase